MYSDQCKSCIVEGCPDSCSVKQAYKRGLAEVVRCKDCKYYTSVTAHCEIRGKGLYLIRGMNDFCSRAERREQ